MANGGAFAEYVSVPEDVLARKPARLSFEQAAAVPTAGLILLANLRGDARLLPGQNVLVNGAGGGVGTVAVQLAKADRARVTGVDTADKLEPCGRSAPTGPTCNAATSMFAPPMCETGKQIGYTSSGVGLIRVTNAYMPAVTDASECTRPSDRT